MTLKSLRTGLLAWVSVLTLGLALTPVAFGQTLGILQAQLFPSLTLTATTNQLTLGASAHTTIFSVTAPSAASQTLTFPDPGGSDSVVYLAKAQTLTTKTLTAPVIATIVNTGTLTLPSATGGLATILYCGSTGTGNQTCSPAAAAATTKTYVGHSTLSSNAAVITFPTAFASTTYDCVANDITTRANPVQMISTSNSTATITNTTGASDVINWSCTGL